MSNQLTDDDYRTVRYFWEAYGDVTRWCDWDQKKSLFEAKHPELTKALQDYKIAKRTISALVKHLEYEGEDEASQS